MAKVYVAHAPSRERKVPMMEFQKTEDWREQRWITGRQWEFGPRRAPDEAPARQGTVAEAVQIARRNGLSKVDMGLAVANARILDQTGLDGIYDMGKARDIWWAGAKKMVPRIPSVLRPMFARAIIQSLKLICRFPNQAKAWDLWFALPFLLLQRRRGYREKSIASHNELTARFLRFAQWDIEELAREAWELQQENERADVLAEKRKNTDGQAGRSSRYEQLVKDSRWGPALKELKRNGAGMRREVDESARELVKTKLGQKPAEYINVLERVKKLRQDNVLKEWNFTPEQIYKTLAGRDKTKGGGMSGLTYRHLADAMEAVEVRSELLKYLAVVVNIVANGRQPTEFLSYMAGGKGGAADNRLFSAGEVLFRLVETMVQASVVQGRVVKAAEEGRQPILRYNCGVGTRGAADLIRFWVLDILSRNAERLDLVILEVDAANMFFELDRKAVLEVVEKRAPELLPLLLYLGVPVFISMFQSRLKVQATTGVNIGSGLASLVATMLEEVELEKLQAWATVENVWMEQMAFVDNLFVITTATEAKRILARLETEGAKVGLKYGLRQSHPHKVHFPFPRKLTRTIPEWLHEFQGFEITAADESFEIGKQGVRLAGVEIGTSAYYRQRLMAKKEKAMAAMELVEEHARPQEAMLLVRNSIIPSVDFLRRMMPVWDTREIIKQMDDEVVQTVQRVLKAPGEWKSDQMKRMWLFYPKGPFAMRRMAGTEEAANIASFVAAARNRASLEMPRTIMQSITDFNLRVGSNGKIKAQTTTALLQEMAGVKKVQKTLAGRLGVREFEITREKAPLEDQYMMDAVREDKATAWLKELDFGTVMDPAGGAKFSLSDEQFRYLMRRLMLGDDPHGTGLKEMQCAWCGQTFNTRMTHAETCCTRVRGANRHNSFQEAVMQIVHSLGGFARSSELSMEIPPACAGNVPLCQGCGECQKTRSVRVDVEFGGLSDDGCYAVDVANVEIRTKGVSYRFEKGRYVTMGRVLNAETEKRNMYEKLCESQRRREFIPAVMSSFAAPGNGAKKLVAVLAERLQQVLGGTAAASKRRVLRRFQAANMREIAVNGLAALREQREAIIGAKRVQGLRVLQDTEVVAQAFMQNHM